MDGSLKEAQGRRVLLHVTCMSCRLQGQAIKMSLVNSWVKHLCPASVNA